MWVNRDSERLDPTLRGGLLATLPSTARPSSPFSVSPGQIAHWAGAPVRGEAGVAALSGVLAFSAWEVPALPDFSSARFPDLAGLNAAERTARVLQGQETLLAQLHGLGPLFGVSLRYLCQRKPGGEARIRLFLIGRAWGATEADAREAIPRFDAVLARAFPSGYPLSPLLGKAARGRTADPDMDDALFPGGITALCEILKVEQEIPAWHREEVSGFSSWYHLAPFAPAAGNDMTGVCAALAAAQGGRLAEGGEKLLIDVTLVPAFPLTPAEQHELSTWGQIAEKWGRDQRVQLPDGLYSRGQTLEIAADPQAAEVRKMYQNLLSRYGGARTRSFLYAARALSIGPAPHARPTVAYGLASALSSHALAPGSGCRFVPIVPEHPAFERAMRAVHGCYVTPAVCNERLWAAQSAPETLRRLHRMVTLEEAAAFFRLPVPGRDGCPGIPKEPGLPSPGRQGEESV